MGGRILRENLTASILIQKSLIVLVSMVATHLAIFPNGLATQIQGASLSDSKEVLAETFGFSDSGSYLRAAIDLNSSGTIQSDFYWVYNLWPPGMPFLESFLISLEPALPFAATYAFVVWFLWSIFFSWLGWMVRDSFGTPLALAFIFIAAQLSPFTDWIFGPGLFYAEGLSSLFFLLGLILFIRAMSQTETTDGGFLASLRPALLIGVSFAFAAYFRAGYSLLIQVGVALLAIGFVISVVMHKRRKSGRLQWFKLAQSRKYAIPILSIITMAAVMLPWQVHASNTVRPGNTQWSTVSALFIAGTWADRDTSASFVAAGGVGWACTIDRVQCEEISERKNTESPNFDESNQLTTVDLAIRSLWVAVLNPLDFAGDRLHFLAKGWFSSEATIGSPATYNGLLNLVLLFLFFSSLWPHIRDGRLWLLAIPILSFSQLLPVVIGHVEPRYFIPIKLLVLCLPAIWSLKSFKKSGEFSPINPALQ